jgi:dephospho-CoA kinase
MIIVGLTGNIGCGKSTISKTFRAHNIPVIDADQVAREVVKPHSLGLTEVIDAFGLRYLKSDGNLDRLALGAFVFADKFALQQLNDIMLPLIKEEAAKQFEALKQAGTILACFSAAMIIENGNVSQYYPVVVAYCSQEQQLARLTKRGLTTEQAKDRIKAQMPTQQKLMYADFGIDTNESKEYSIKQTETVIAYLKSIKE